jgi:hypothetical protein
VITLGLIALEGVQCQASRRRWKVTAFQVTDAGQGFLLSSISHIEVGTYAVGDLEWSVGEDIWT